MELTGWQPLPAAPGGKLGDGKRGKISGNASRYDVVGPNPNFCPIGLETEIKAHEENAPANKTRYHGRAVTCTFREHTFTPTINRPPTFCHICFVFLRLYHRSLHRCNSLSVQTRLHDCGTHIHQSIICLPIPDPIDAQDAFQGRSRLEGP